jgi:hypothetical protein
VSQAARKAENESRFREANEQIERSGQALLGGLDDHPMPFLCECPRMECTAVVLMTFPEYEFVRADGRRGLAALGHEDLSIERVLDRNDRFVTTEKFGEAGDVHADNDPRE